VTIETPAGKFYEKTTVALDANILLLMIAKSLFNIQKESKLSIDK
jgi:hypothetical protein